MVAIAPPQVVNGAARAPLPYGLFSILGFRGGEERWENGVIFESLSCDPAGGIGEPDCEPNAPAVAEVFDVAITGAPTSGTFQITDGTRTSTAIAAPATWYWPRAGRRSWFRLPAPPGTSIPRTTWRGSRRAEWSGDPAR